MYLDLLRAELTAFFELECTSSDILCLGAFRPRPLPCAIQCRCVRSDSRGTVECLSAWCVFRAVSRENTRSHGPTKSPLRLPNEQLALEEARHETPLV